MPDLLRILGASGSWIAIYAAIVVGAFVVFTGTAMAVALFHPEEPCAERARKIFKDLLGLFRWGRR